MANVFAVNVYQINQKAVQDFGSLRIAFPTTGVLLRDCSGSATRSVGSNSVYGIVQTSDGNQYYVRETIAQLITAVG